MKGLRLRLRRQKIDRSDLPFPNSHSRKEVEAIADTACGPDPFPEPRVDATLDQEMALFISARPVVGPDGMPAAAPAVGASSSSSGVVEPPAAPELKPRKLTAAWKDFALSWSRSVSETVLALELAGKDEGHIHTKTWARWYLCRDVLCYVVWCDVVWCVVLCFVVCCVMLC